MHREQSIDLRPKHFIQKWGVSDGEHPAPRCLLRYHPRRPNFALFSALAYDDPYHDPLRTDLPGAANAAWREHLAQLGFQPDKMEWVLHYGLFSTYDRLWTSPYQQFIGVRLKFGSEGFHGPQDIFAPIYKVNNLMLTDVEELVPNLWG